ncbi:MAG TPA: HNH endonuclease [Candidatus Eisenbacteria bacterium]|nr:HNH endonuclease [Candidatus Eisenbacteria bacterium]
MSHIVPNAGLAQILDDALEIAIRHREKRKFGRTEKPRAPRISTNPRHIPARVRRVVHARDGARCTFVADDGHRCEARRHLEFDHIEPLARGGASTADNLRLRCRAHNQLAAEQAFGVGFMDAKRGATRPAAEQAQASAERERLLDVMAALRSLGCRAEQARHLAERSNAPGLTLEQHVRAALRLVYAARAGRRDPAVA